MESTQQTTRHSDAKAEAWTLIIAHHTNAACIGRRLILEEGQPLALGRDLATLDNDKRLSRVHATIKLEGDVVTVTDEASRNGTFVDGARVTRATLAAGSLLGVGGVILLLHRRRCFFELPDNPRVAAVSFAMSEVLADVARAAHRGQPVLLIGETGVGKGLLAEELHLASGREGPFVAVHAGSIADEGVHAQLFGEGTRAGLLETADGGTLFLDGVDDARPSLQAALLSVLERGEVRRVGDPTARRLDLRVLASAREQPKMLRADFLARIGGWSIEIPPLRERREDIGAIAARFLAEMEGAPSLHHELALLLLAHDWPGNVRELQAVLARAASEQTGELRETERIAAMLGGKREEELPSPEGYAVARNGAFFEAPGIGRVSLESRKVLQGLLHALADADGRALSVVELVAAGWPGEKVLPRAGASRVYVSITSLRKMGLREAIERTGVGYRIRSTVRVV